MQILTNPEIGANLRVIDRNSQHWFVAKDVCEALGILQTGPAIQKLDEDEVNQIHLIDSMNRKQLAYVVSESGLYALILRSDKPAAKAFRRWVTGEVLPKIRQSGGYSATAARIKNLTDRQELARGKFLEVSAELVALRAETARMIARELGISAEMGNLLRAESKALPAPVLEPAKKKQKRNRQVYRLDYGELALAMPGPMKSAELVNLIMRSACISKNAAFKRMARAVDSGFLIRQNSIYSPKTQNTEKQ
jgi:prophage antirepressor-like protein